MSQSSGSSGPGATSAAAAYREDLELALWVSICFQEYRTSRELLSLIYGRLGAYQHVQSGHSLCIDITVPNWCIIRVTRLQFRGGRRLSNNEGSLPGCQRRLSSIDRTLGRAGSLSTCSSPQKVIDELSCADAIISPLA
jgi:hypothetical protein